MNGNNVSRFADLSVLIIEDNAVNQKVTLAMLNHFNIAADVAENGQIGLDCAAKKKYDLILMDCQMPVKNGFETTRAIRELDQQAQPDFKTASDVIIIAMSANVESDDIAECKECGMNDFVAKPVELEVVASMLDKWFK